MTLLRGRPLRSMATTSEESIGPALGSDFCWWPVAGKDGDVVP